MRKQRDSGHPIPKAIPGKTSPFCGGDTSQLVVRTASPSDDSSLWGRCHRCLHPQNLSADFTSVLWI